MMRKKHVKDLTWNVLHYDFNRGEVVDYNVLAHGSFLDDVKKARKKIGDNAEFLEEVRSLLRYYFWSKCEHEVLVGGLFPGEGENPRKIDAFDQVDMNWEAFSSYLLANIGGAR